MRRVWIAWLLLLNFGASLPVFGQSQPASTPTLARVLLIVAHPDDESEMAGTVYRIARELSGAVDQVIISDGEPDSAIRRLQDDTMVRT